MNEYGPQQGQEQNVSLLDLILGQIGSLQTGDTVNIFNFLPEAYKDVVDQNPESIIDILHHLEASGLVTRGESGYVRTDMAIPTPENNQE